MTNDVQSAQTTAATVAKDAWVKPEITSFAAAVDAQAVGGVGADAGVNQS